MASDLATTTIETFDAVVNHGNAVTIANDDHITIKIANMSRLGGGLGTGLEITCGEGDARNEGGAFYFNSTLFDSVFVRGLEWCGANETANPGPRGPVAVNFFNGDTTTVLSQPFWGVGTEGLWFADTSPQPTHGQVYFQGSNPVVNFQANNIGAAGGATGSFSIVMNTVTNLSVGMYSQGNANIPDGAIITSFSGGGNLTVNLSVPLTGNIGAGTPLTFYAPVRLCPENGQGLIVDNVMRYIPMSCLWRPMADVSGFVVPNNTGIYYGYVGSMYSQVRGAVSSDATRNLVRLTLDTTAGFQTGNTIACSGITGTTEANTPANPQLEWVGNLVDGTHVDLQGVTFANAYTGGGRCRWLGIFANRAGHNANNTLVTGFNTRSGFWGLGFNGVQVANFAPYLTLVGAFSPSANGGNTFVFQLQNSPNVTLSPASWFNRKPHVCSSTINSDTAGIGAGYSALNPTPTCFSWHWNDQINSIPGNVANPISFYPDEWSIQGRVNNSTGGDGCNTTAGFSGTTPEAQVSSMVSSVNTNDMPVSASGSHVYTGVEGVSTVNVLGQVITGGSCVWRAGLNLTVRSWY